MIPLHREDPGDVVVAGPDIVLNQIVCPQISPPLEQDSPVCWS